MRSAPSFDTKPRRSWLRAAGLGLLLGNVLLRAASVSAHAGPQVRRIVFGGDAIGRVLVSNRGLFFGGASGSDWRLMCNEALGVTTSELPEIVGLADGRILAATSRGLFASSDRGCSWQGVEPFAMTTIPSLVQHPRRPERLYATAYGNGVSGFYESEDAAAHWQRVYAAEDGEYLRYLHFAPSEPDRLYVRKLALDGMRLVYSLMSSGDAGKSWASHPVEVKMDETDLVLLGVSPTDPNLVVAKAEAASPGAVAERLLVSRDGGRTFDTPFSARSISAVEWSLDGRSVWLASDEGLFRSDGAAEQFTRVGAAEFVTCLRQTDRDLLLCGYYGGSAAGMSGVGTTSDGGESNTPWMSMTDVAAPIDCAAEAPTSMTCAPWWADWKREILDASSAPPPSAADASAPNAMTVSSAGRTPESRTDSGCTAVPSAKAPVLLPAAFFLLLVVCARRRF